MRFFLFLLFLIISSLTIFGQQPKSPSYSCPPSIYGFKLGMTIAQAERRAGRNFELMRIADLPGDFQAVGFYRSSKPSPSKIHLGLGFYNGILYRISATYDDSIRWLSVDAFTSWLSGSMKIKPIWTNIHRWDGSLEIAMITCSNAQLTATKMAYNQWQKYPFDVTLRDEAASIREQQVREAALKLKDSL